MIQVPVHMYVCMYVYTCMYDMYVVCVYTRALHPLPVTSTVTVHMYMMYVCLKDFMCLNGSICKMLLGSHASK